MAYPVTFDVPPPPKEFDKAQIALRIVLIIIIGWLAIWVVSAAYWLLPILAAVMISQKGAEQYLADVEKGPVRWIRYLMGFYTYISLASDKLPFDDPDSVNFHVRTTGSPTVGQTLLRIILAIPHAIVLVLLFIVFVVVWIIAAASILINGVYPDGVFDFSRGYLRWETRLLAYMASLADDYPPFSFQNGEVAAPGGGVPPSHPSATELPPTQPSEQAQSESPSESSTPSEPTT